MSLDRSKTNQIDPGQESETYDDAKRLYVETLYRKITDSHGPFTFDDGSTFAEMTLAYETYGELNAAHDNAIMIFHALTGGPHMAFWHKDDKRPGWWDTMVGPGKAFDTDRFFVISANVPGSCYGSTGPASINPESGRPYGTDFPEITVRDMVRAQAWLLDDLGIDKLVAVAGGSMGGMQALQFGVSYPDRAQGLIAIACTSRHSAQQIAFNEVGRQAILRDPGWCGGDYYEADDFPEHGLAVARMIGHITYLSDVGMHEKFARRAKSRGKSGKPFEIDFEVAGYLDYQGWSFTQRFDANAYLYLTKAIDTFDLAEGYDSYQAAYTEGTQKFLFITYSSDWLYPPQQLREVAHDVRRVGKSATYCEIDAIYGHDSFLLKNPEQEDLVRGFLTSLERLMSR